MNIAIFILAKILREENCCVKPCCTVCMCNKCNNPGELCRGLGNLEGPLGLPAIDEALSTPLPHNLLPLYKS